jgi:hypothetical protein
MKILINEIHDIQLFDQKVKTALGEITTRKPPEFDNTLAKSVKDSVLGLQTMTGDIDLKKEPVQAFVESVRRAEYLSVSFDSRTRNLDSEKQPPVVAEVAELAIKQEKDDAYDFTSQVPAIMKLFLRVRRFTDEATGAKAPSKWEDLKADISAATAEAQKLEEIYKRWFEERTKKVADRLTRLEGALQSAIQSRQEQIKQLGKEQNDIARKLDQQKQDQHSTDKMLVYAVYAMIAAIVLLFLSLRLFKDGLATAIVNERTMIELLSMGFLLLTLIILGTGKQLQETTLGTLLGTVAGYIFGRKEGEKRGAQQERQELAKMVTDANPAGHRA